MRIRQPIISVLGHVDSGKTTLLDRIRGSSIAKEEAGGITQHIGASEIPIENIKRICGDLIKKIGVEIKIPGLLFIDTPGHEAFTTLRKRGGSIADIAVLVVDINEGFQPQTDESLTFLKEFKTPFVIAATKIDRILGWHSEENACFIKNYSGQQERAQDELEEKLYKLVGQLSERGFKSERYDRVSDFSKEICIVPVSGITGEGVPDLLMILTGLAQKYLEKNLEIQSDMGKGTILEVRGFSFFFQAEDGIRDDGAMRKGDSLIIGGKEIVITKIKALLKPEPLKEMRVERTFKSVDEVSAAAGIKIAAPNLDYVIAGSPVRSAGDEENIQRAIKDIEAEIEEVEIETDKEGIIIKADTLGSLEGLIKALKDLKLPIRKAKVGNVVKSDVTESSAMKKPVIFAFHVDVLPDAEELAKNSNVKIFKSNVIYKLIEDYQRWEDELKKNKEKMLLESVTHPGRVRVLPGYIFRQSKPAIFGVEVLEGSVKPGYKLKKGEKIIGEIKELQHEGKNVDIGRIGDKLAVSMEGIVVGRHLNEGDILETVLEKKDIEILDKLRSKLPEDEKILLDKIKKEHDFK
ncbi:MAG: translation initiation factor IF-2 [Candidatus Aenigmarchaeota archaeon]|nr:translation initiation factor IF-2 [Candidatus Aenigmarchaeota archaeon]